MATPAKVSLPPTRLAKHAHAYGKRFNTKIPSAQLRLASMSRSNNFALSRQIKQALNAGHPNPEWEAQLQRARDLPPQERSVQDMIDAEPLPVMTEPVKKPANPISIRSATPADYEKRKHWQITLGGLKGNRPEDRKEHEARQAAKEDEKTKTD